jgi:hypothetical protein
LAQPADNPNAYDWSKLEPAQESLREHMARIKELEAQLSQPAQEQRPWVGLTAEDFSAIKFPAEMRFPAEFRAGARWAEVKLKDKNT